MRTFQSLDAPTVDELAQGTTNGIFLAADLQQDDATLLTRRLSPQQVLGASEYVVVVPFAFFGDAVLNQVFGQTQPTFAYDIVGLEIDAQNGPTGSALTVTLVDGTNTPIAGSVTIPDGQTSARASFAAISLAANVITRAKITAIGSTTPGSWISLRLLLNIP